MLAYAKEPWPWIYPGGASLTESLQHAMRRKQGFCEPFRNDLIGFVAEVLARLAKTWNRKLWLLMAGFRWPHGGLTIQLSTCNRHSGECSPLHTKRQRSANHHTRPSETQSENATLLYHNDAAVTTHEGKCNAAASQSCC